MNTIQFEEGACDKTRRYMDSYISSELLVETTHEVLRHLERCPACRQEAEARTRLRSRLRNAVSAQEPPPYLEARIRARLRAAETGRRSVGGLAQWAMAAAALLVIGSGVWLAQSRWSLPDLHDRPGQDAYIQRVSSSMSAVLRVGLSDHLHCSVFRRYTHANPSFEQMAAAMGPAWRGLLDAVRERLPEGYRMLMAHQCGYKNRRFVHLTMGDGNGRLLSVVVTRRNPGESLASLSPASVPGGVPVYAASAHQFSVAGIETGPYLAFVVSDTGKDGNLLMASRMVPAIHGFLASMKG